MIFHGEIPLEPVSWARPRKSRNGGFYTAKKQADAGSAAKLHLHILWRKNAVIEGPISLRIVFWLPIPKKYQKKGVEGKPHIKRPDTDNFLKQFLDSANEILFKDDSQVWKVEATKVYGTRPRTEFTIEY